MNAIHFHGRGTLWVNGECVYGPINVATSRFPVGGRDDVDEISGAERRDEPATADKLVVPESGEGKSTPGTIRNSLVPTRREPFPKCSAVLRKFARTRIGVPLLHVLLGLFAKLSVFFTELRNLCVGEIYLLLDERNALAQHGVGRDVGQQRDDAPERALRIDRHG